MTKKQVYQILSNIFFLLTGIVLLYFAFRGQNLAEIYHQLKNVDYVWFLPVLIVSVFGHLIRAQRWRMLMQTMNTNPSLPACYNALMFGYLVNLAVPRLGEVSRCIALKKKEGTSFNKAFGVVITERLIDVFMLILLVGLVLILQYDLVHDFFANYVYQPLWLSINQKISGLSWFIKIVFILITTTGIFMISRFLWLQIKKLVKNRKPGNFIEEIARGMLSIIKLKQKGWFVCYTLLIWLSYYFTTYFWFFALEPTRNLGPSAGLVIGVISNFARTIPIQGGGMGAYHFLVSKALGLYSINALYGNIFALLNHGAQTIYQIVFGAAGGIWCFLPNPYRAQSENAIYETGQENKKT